MRMSRRGKKDIPCLLALLVRELDAVLPRAHVLLVELDRRLRLASKGLEERGDISREATTAAGRRERCRRSHRPWPARRRQGRAVQLKRAVGSELFRLAPSEF